MAILIAISLTVLTGNFLYGVLSGLAWGFYADSLIGILIALAVIGGMGAILGVA